MSVALKTSPTGAVARTLGDVYGRLADLCEVLSVRVAEPGTEVARAGVTAAELTKDQFVLDAFVEAEAARIQERYGTVPRRHVAASRALHDYAWSVSLLMSGVWYLERRVPRIRPEDLRLDLATAEFTLVPGVDLTCLADDPAGALPGVVTVPHEEALRAELRVAVAEHMEPLLTAIGPTARRGSRALWGMVADDLVSGIWYLGRTLGREDDAVRAATELLPTGRAPYPGGADFRYLTTDDGRRHPTRTRTGCCMYYTIRPDEACATCPRTCDTERLRRLQS
ncbi:MULTISPECIES: (2Fe-2S)-binding protein [unclassified Streptomyces]|uniref:(2Fe-2S)-binding protein n=1 Tax=unclassified Streptomyces TaxID=2593676 RepID=UPI00236625EE|nr:MULTISPECIES: (2Fe-2S)-binding protein [unclassified Streptomyces]MDF3148958.1 (2Fe-2S)-binding protein [Streptomyces sp. T21Q-yed]WDF35508.1 (2Fe-2S)-binding protein [Streptomyces sp. T12]